jgi:hypothetical protein
MATKQTENGTDHHGKPLPAGVYALVDRQGAILTWLVAAMSSTSGLSPLTSIAPRSGARVSIAWRCAPSPAGRSSTAPIVSLFDHCRPSLAREW